MPRGPKGEKRPADTIGCAVLVARIATGEVEEVVQSPSRTASLSRAVSRKNITNKNSNSPLEQKGKKNV